MKKRDYSSILLFFRYCDATAITPPRQPMHFFIIKPLIAASCCCLHCQINERHSLLVAFQKGLLQHPVLGHNRRNLFLCLFLHLRLERLHLGLSCLDAGQALAPVAFHNQQRQLFLGNVDVVLDGIHFHFRLPVHVRQFLLQAGKASLRFVGTIPRI